MRIEHGFMGDFRMFDTSCYLLDETLLDPCVDIAVVEDE